ncbi:hypothetical protein Taro_039078 [Colocasia esculenta]|uniref:Receptor kinase-like protein Xa21 n=1 Tax=Colocasia esculenta TaxID=4460 RepID=A0A843WEP2_COLES|nr:hypothetical protein [Colocasia esculenta]
MESTKAFRFPRAITTLLPPQLPALVLCFFAFCVSAASSQSRVSSTASEGSSRDQMALLAFKLSLAGDPLGVVATWNESRHVCRWRGVACGGGRHPERVTALDLHSLGLSGSIPTAVANLSFLGRLDLSNNSFNGNIPEELGHLARLRHLNLSSNSLSGSIPASLGRCSGLRNISFKSNMLSGTLPPSLGNLSSLQILSLSRNHLTGRIPSSLGNTTSLTVLLLGSNSLTGEIPAALGNLHRLMALELRNNSLSGTIPPSLGNLSSLVYFLLSSNSLGGDIPPSLGELSSVQFLYLSRNQFTGVIPLSLSGLPSLAELSLAQNDLTGSIPPSLGNLTALTLLNLEGNSLVGTIPSTLGDLRSLTSFCTRVNRLTGSVPHSLYNLSSLALLDLGSNQLSGTLPSDMGTSLPNLQFLTLADNQLHGSIPPSILNASSLQVIQLYTNNFSGVVPPGIGSLRGLQELLLYENMLEARGDEDWSFLESLANGTRLQSLVISNNNLGSILPYSISNLSTDLRVLDLGGNHISGSLPKAIGGLKGLTSFSVERNNLDGEVPTTIGTLRKLSLINLSWNKFSGRLPSSISSIIQLNYLYVDGNRLQGVIPPSFGNLRNLLELYLSHNQFTGVIPKELVSISSLSIFLDLSHNSFTGSLPDEVGRLRNLRKMDISANKLSGKIPVALGDCEILEMLYMQGNAFQGEVPRSFSKLRGLQALDLSRNNLSGEIPEFLQNFTSLQHLNLSFNDFVGRVPDGGIFRNASAVSVLGNGKLCGDIKDMHLPVCSPREHSRGRHKFVLLITMIATSLVGVCLVIFVAYLIFSHYWRRKSPHLSAAPSHELLTRTTYSELLKATEGFSPRNLIGAGSFGSVYRGNMDPSDPDAQIVAVKVINLQQRGASKSFIAECEALKNIRHRNLLKILTSCSSVDFSGRDFKALVFEFMPNGSLDQWLHPVRSEDSEKHLSFVQRLNIAVDVASALAYLHHHSGTPVVHCDLKPSNVLLDKDMTAHVGDFGLARFLSNGDRSKATTSSLILRGSIGYVAPEYGMGCKPSTEGDVFSYGVVLLEMITGRSPTDSTFVDNLTLQHFVEMALPERLLDIVDRSLLIEEEDDLSARHVSQAIGSLKRERLEGLVSMAGLALMCSKESPSERMGMEDVAKEITIIRDTFLKHEVAHGRMANSISP